MENNKIRIFCDIDDTLWDLLPYWINYNNVEYMSYYPDTPQCEYLSTDLSKPIDMNTQYISNQIELIGYEVM